VNPLRRPLIAGNWKMNAGGRDACALAVAVADVARKATHVDVVVCPPFTALAAAAHELFEAKSAAMLGAQNMHPEPAGAFTGEVRAPIGDLPAGGLDLGPESVRLGPVPRGPRRRAGVGGIQDRLRDVLPCHRATGLVRPSRVSSNPRCCGRSAP